MMQSRKIIWLTLVVFVVFLQGSARRAAASPQNQDQGQSPGAQQGSFPVGHATRILNVTGTRGETRPVNVHLWYPAPDPQNCQSGDGNSQGCPPSVYTSRLNGVPLLPQWDPLPWTIGSTQAFEELPVSSAKSSWPVIIFSHGNQNNAIDYVYTLEALASYGFIVAAPDHVNNTQDDVRIDFINGQAGSTVIPCFDGLPSPCAHADLAESMTDRVNDIREIIKALPTWFGDRADLSRIGVLGHSRGGATALAAAGGSTTWGFPAEPRVKAIMGLASGGLPAISGTNVQAVTVPALLVAGELDMASPPAISQDAYKMLGTPLNEKQFVLILKAKHRHFVSGSCAQTQSAGAIAAANPTRAILDLDSIRRWVHFAATGTSMDVCGFDTFTNPTDIRSLVASLTISPPQFPQGFNVTATNVPVPPPGATTGLTSDEVKDQVVQLAVGFFGTRL